MSEYDTVVDTLDINAAAGSSHARKRMPGHNHLSVYAAKEVDTGLEALLILNAHFSRYLSLDSEIDILIPEVATRAWEFTFENRLRLLLSRFVNMDIVLNFERVKPIVRLQSRQQVLMRFVYLL